MPGHTHQARIVPVGEVRTGAAVNVDIHQPRDHQRPVQILRRARDILQHMGKPPVFHREASPDEPSVRKIQPFSYRISRTSRGPAAALIFHSIHHLPVGMQPSFRPQIPQSELRIDNPRSG